MEAMQYPAVSCLVLRRAATCQCISLEETLAGPSRSSPLIDSGIHGYHTLSTMYNPPALHALVLHAARLWFFPALQVSFTQREWIKKLGKTTIQPWIFSFLTLQLIVTQSIPSFDWRRLPGFPSSPNWGSLLSSFLLFPLPLSLPLSSPPPSLSQLLKIGFE